MSFEAYNPPAGFHPWEPDLYYYGPIGPLFLQNRGDKVVFGFRCGEKHVNAGRICHGGMLFTLMDIELGFSANIQTGRPGFMITVNMTSDFLAPVREGQWVEAHGEVVKETRSLIFVEGRLYADGELSLRANAVMKASKGLVDYVLADVLPPLHKD